jgi:hypothetical protein
VASLAGEGQKVFRAAIPGVHNTIFSEMLQRPALQHHPKVKRGVATPAFPALRDLS